MKYKLFIRFYNILHYSTMSLTHLPKDTIDIIVSNSHRYNLIFVNKHFKNMFYHDFKKCDVCNKVISIKGTNLWNTDCNKEGCHNSGNFMRSNYIDFFQFGHEANTAKCLMSLLKKSNNCNISITDKIRITTETNDNDMAVESDVLHATDMNYLKGDYNVTIHNDDLETLKQQSKTNIVTFFRGDVFLHYINNKYTKSNHKLQLITSNKYNTLDITSRNRFQMHEKNENTTHS